MDLREKVANRIFASGIMLGRDEADQSVWECAQQLADQVLTVPEIASALAAQMPDLPPERVGEIMRGLRGIEGRLTAKP